MRASCKCPIARGTEARRTRVGDMQQKSVMFREVSGVACSCVGLLMEIQPEWRATLELAITQTR